MEIKYNNDISFIFLHCGLDTILWGYKLMAKLDRIKDY